MTIIVSKEGRGAKRIEESGVPKEGFLEEYVAANPESLPLDDIRDDLKLVTLARQFPTSSGPIDVLAVNDQGDLYIIETKLFRNPDKREVVAQVLDYGAALWRDYTDSAKFLMDADNAISQRREGGLNARLRDGLGLESEGLEGATDAMRENIRNGTLRFIVLMDTLHDRLRNLILYLNERSRFTVYAVEMRFYRH